MHAVHPRDAHAQRARLATRFEALGRLDLGADLEAERRALLGAWSAHAREPLGWLEAPAHVARGAALEARIGRLHRRAVAGGASSAARWHTGYATGYGVTWPHHVLDYRNLWDGYVMGTARAANECAKGEPLDGSNLTHDLYAAEMIGYADGIAIEWNEHAGAEDREIMMQAGDFLQDYQRVVRRVAEFYQPQIRAACPKAKLPDPPGWRMQVPVISAIEDAEILTHGTLQILAIGAGGALEAIDAVGKEVGKDIGKTADHLPAIAIAAGLVAGAVILKTMVGK